MYERISYMMAWCVLVIIGIPLVIVMVSSRLFINTKVGDFFEDIEFRFMKYLIHG